jgi:hypothetical protein
MENEDEDLLDMEEEAPATGLSALVSEDPRSFLIENARKRAEERSKLFQGELDRLEAAKQKLLAQPTQLTRQEALRAIASRLTQRPSDPRDPRFFEKRNLFSTLRDIGEVGGEMSAAEKKLKEEQAAKVAQLEEMRGRYLYGEAERGEREAATALARYRPPAVPKLQANAQKIIDLQSIVDDTSKPEQARKAAQRELDNIGKNLSPEDRSTLGQMIQATTMANSSDPNQARIGKAFLSRFEVKTRPLSVREKREDLEIEAAKEYLKSIPQADLDRALRSISANRTPYMQRIIRAWELSQKPTFSSAISSSESEKSSEDNLTDEERAELEQLRNEFGK